MAKSSSMNWGKVGLWAVVLLIVVFFVFPLLAQIGGAIGSFFQSILKVTGSITDTVTAPFRNIANDVAAGNAGAVELQSDLNVTDVTNPWSPLYYQQDAVSSEFTSLADVDAQDLVNTLQKAASLLGGWTVGDQTVAITNALQDNIGSQAELSAFADYWQSHTGTVLVAWLNGGGFLGMGWSYDNTTWDPVSKWARGLPTE